MSMFGSSFFGEIEEDPFFGQHMRSMRQMNSMMNTMFADPFGMFGGGGFGGFDPFGPSALTGGNGALSPMGGRHFPNAMSPFGFASMPNINRLLNADIPNGATSFSSSQIVSMTQGPDGRPQVYQASSSTKTGPGGIRETQKTVQDSRSGVKKMAIGHHIGERAHVIEREKNLRTGDEEERQDFINLEEEEADNFNREFTERSRVMGRRQQQAIEMPAIMPAQGTGSTTSSNPTLKTATNEPIITFPSDDEDDVNESDNKNVNDDSARVTIVTSPSIQGFKHHHIPKQYQQSTSPNISARRPIRSSPLTTSQTSSMHHPHPYNVHSNNRRAHRPMKGSTSSQQYQNTSTGNPGTISPNPPNQ